MDVRLMTIAMPSVARKRPARRVSAGEWKRFWASRHRRQTVMMPQMAAAIRHPTGSDWPKIFMPSAISHFPVGGCTG